MQSELNTAMPQTALPTMPARRSAILAHARRRTPLRRVATSGQPWRRRVAATAATGAFLTGLATTLYIALDESMGIAMRPVQMVPLVLLPFALAMPCNFAVARQFPLRFLPLLWTAYMTIRFLFLEPTDSLTAARALSCLATFFAVMDFSARQKRLNAVLIGLLAGCLVSVSFAAADISIFGKEPRYVGNARWCGLMPDPNRFADLCGIAFVICFAMIIQRTATSTRAAWAICLAVCGGGLLASGSRGGLFATALASLATIGLIGMAQNRRLPLSTYFKSILVLCIAGGAATLVFGDYVSERVWEFAKFSHDGRSNLEDDPRREIAVAAFEKFQGSPLFGGGAETLSIDTGEFASHNSYLYLLSTSGVVSFGLYGAFVVVLVRSLWKTVRQRSLPAEIKVLTVPALGGLLFLFIHMCVIDLILSAHVWAFFGYAAAVAVRCSAESIFSTAQQRMKVCA